MLSDLARVSLPRRHNGGTTIVVFESTFCAFLGMRRFFVLRGCEMERDNYKEIKQF